MSEINEQRLFDAVNAGDGCAIQNEVYGKPGLEQIKAFHHLSERLSKLPKPVREPAPGSMLNYGLVNPGLDFTDTKEETRAQTKDGKVVEIRIGDENTGGNGVAMLRSGIGGGKEINPIIEIDAGPIDHLRPIFTEEIAHYSGAKTSYGCTSKSGDKLTKREDKNSNIDGTPYVMRMWQDVLK